MHSGALPTLQMELFVTVVNSIVKSFIFGVTAVSDLVRAVIRFLTQWRHAVLRIVPFNNERPGRW